MSVSHRLKMLFANTVSVTGLLLCVHMQVCGVMHSQAARSQCNSVLCLLMCIMRLGITLCCNVGQVGTPCP